MPARKKHTKRRERPTSAINDLKKAAAAFESARLKRNAARETLARISKPGDPHHIVDRSSAWMETALRRVRNRILRIQGVVGIGLGSRVRNGIQTGEPCISVFVSKKISPDKLRAKKVQEISELTRVGKRVLKIDVVELGRLERQVSVGDEIGPARARQAGTLGVFARDTNDNAPVAVTAMHVSGFRNIPINRVTSVPFCMPSRISGNHGRVFADLVRGTTWRIDAAKLRLHAPRVPGGMIPGLGPIAGWRPLTYPGDIRTTVFMLGAVSGLQQGFIVNTSVDLPDERLENAILVNIRSSRGDSGSAIVDTERFLLGFLVGTGSTRLGNLRVFCPAGLVFSELGCDIP